LLQISREHSFTEKFVENYVTIAKRFATADDEKYWERALLYSISQIILKSDQREFFLKLVSHSPEKSLLIPSEPEAEVFKSHHCFGKVRALMKCANCGVLEKSENQFQKCSRCGFVFYCSKACQRNDWQNHKQVCKEVRKQN